MKTLVLMLCAGPMGKAHYSWHDEERPRHLLPIAGEPLVRRTARLIRRFGHDPVVVTKTPYIAELFRDVFEPENDYLLYDTMLSTRELWDSADRVVFVQCDHLLYEDFFKRVFETEGSANWEADHGPPAVIFARKDYDRCVEGLQHLSSIHKLFQDCMQHVKGFVPPVHVYRDRSLYDMDNDRIYDLMCQEEPWVLTNPKPVLLLLAAGRGSRLGSGAPKALMEFGGATVAERIVDELLRHGLSEIVVTVGHEQEKVRNLLGTERGGVPVTYIYNPDFATTGSGTSITLARGKLKGRKSYVFEADQVLDPRLVAKLARSPFLDCVLADPDPQGDPGLWVGGDIVESVVWSDERQEGMANMPYFLKLSEGGSEILCEFEDDGGVESLIEVAKRLPVHVVDTGGLPWAHFNTPRGLEYAREQFPRI